MVGGQPHRARGTDPRRADAGRFNWFSIDYRLGGLHRFEDSLADIRAAVTFIRCRSRELGIDRDRLVLLGEDSGAHLAALLAAERLPGVIGAALVGGFYDLASTPAVTKDVEAAVVARASPLTHAARTPTPLLVVHGSADSEAPIEQAQRYCRSVEGAKGTCRFLEVEGASHRSENWWPSQWGYKRDVVTWLSTLAPVPLEPHQPHAETALLKDIVYSDSAKLKLDAFVPRTTKPVPAVIIVHGGGWEAGDKVTYVTPLFEPLARAGLAWFSIDYRLTPAATHQEQLADVRQAIQFVRAGHARFNIDPARIILVGESASGQMVAQIATEDAVARRRDLVLRCLRLSRNGDRRVAPIAARASVPAPGARRRLAGAAAAVLTAVSGAQEHAAAPADQRHRGTLVGPGAGLREAAHRARREA